MNGDILRITAERGNIVFDPLKSESLITKSCILFRKCLRLGEAENAQPVVDANMDHWHAAVHRLDDQAARLRSQLVFRANDEATACILVSMYCVVSQHK